MSYIDVYGQNYIRYALDPPLDLEFGLIFWDLADSKIVLDPKKISESGPGSRVFKFRLDLDSLS